MLLEFGPSWSQTLSRASSARLQIAPSTLHPLCILPHSIICSMMGLTRLFQTFQPFLFQYPILLSQTACFLFDDTCLLSTEICSQCPHTCSTPGIMKTVCQSTKRVTPTSMTTTRGTRTTEGKWDCAWWRVRWWWCPLYFDPQDYANFSRNFEHVSH